MPLLLHECAFNDLQFYQPAHAQQGLRETAQAALDHHIVMSGIYSQLLAKLKAQAKEAPQTLVLPLSSATGPTHVNLLKRALEPLLEDRLARLDKLNRGNAPNDAG